MSLGADSTSQYHDAVSGSYLPDALTYKSVVTDVLTEHEDWNSRVSVNDLAERYTKGETPPDLISGRSI